MVFRPLLLALVSLAATAAERPNIVLIYADDLGFGDLGCYGATAVSTPHTDRIAAEGIRFTDAHSPAATCTPSRYAMLTGEYAWRRPGTGIARGDAPLILDPARPTLASTLRGAGYRTGVVGKWHLGLGPAEGADWNGEIKPGPLELGFDYAFLVPATGDRVPCVYVENHRVAGLDPADPIEVSFGKPVGDWPTGRDRPDLLRIHPSHGHNQTIINGISRIGTMTGGRSALWKDEDMADVITEKAVGFLEENRAWPFFLYFSYHDIHVPRVPHPRFAGRTDMGPRGDAIAQMDWCTGQVLETLARLGLEENTLVIFTSDNGPVIDDGYRDQAVERLGAHQPAGPFRGGKYSIYEAGTRIPFMARWPGKIEAGQTSGALISQVDLPATLASLTGTDPGEGAGNDGVDVLPALLGRDRDGRTHLVEQARGLALRVGDWKYIPPNKGARINRSTNTELGNESRPRLYHLAVDAAERADVSGRYPARAERLAKLLERIVGTEEAP